MRLKPLAVAVDDDEFFRKALEVVLPRLGVDVKAVSKPDLFLEYVRKLNPDLCFIDLKLAGVCGFELIEKVKKLNPDVTVIVISGSEQTEDISNAIEKG